ncbi:hypothetical protein DL766_005131 [Monosporascus sp. MC13-8B]|uniref:Uncharacterized protein n=1 Tax=Monosporascus cannonballus TaxID=155416 RepID=A0ABY0HET0_9PEZI|nr:hypothetical protein DL762_002999 [Monosporascus cannonballus]RYO96101.1 hypothetical protein DL763_003391 [Monosporascus cannonballus]RYP29932.1 hypothetical protein DL766_005131 [Monosporascus sp. MC13-8B]
MGIIEGELIRGDWNIPGLKFANDAEPMTHRKDMRALLLNPWFCRAGKEAPRHNRFEANLRVIINAYLTFYVYSGLGEEFWSALASRLCHFWHGPGVERVVRVYTDARRRYLREVSPDVHKTSNGIVGALDACLNRTSKPPHSKSIPGLRQSFEAKLREWDRNDWMWPPRHQSGHGDNQLSINGLAARAEGSPPKGNVDQSHPDAPPRGPRMSIRGISERSRGRDDNEGPSLASCITGPAQHGSLATVTPNHESDSDDDSTAESPLNPRKRAASFLCDVGPSKRRHGDTDSDAKSPRKGPERVEGERQDTSPGGKTVVSTSTAREQQAAPEAQVEDEVAKPAETTRQLDAERIDSIETQLKAIGELLDRRFVGIEAQVKALHERVAKNAAPLTDTSQPTPLPQQQQVSPTREPYLDEYLRTRNHNTLVKGVVAGIHSLKRDLLYGLKDHEHDKTSDAWEKMESLWLALDNGEQGAKGCP